MINKKYTLKFTIVTLFTTLFLFTMFVVIILPYLRNRNAILELPNYIVKKNTEQAIDKTRQYLSNIANLTKLTSEYFQINILDIKQKEQFKWYSAKVLRNHPSLISVNIGDEKGNTWGAERRKDGVINNFHIIRKSPGSKNASLLYKFYNENDKLIKTEKRKSTYDPRKRPWYIGAKEMKTIFWTNTYVYAADNSPVGITVSFPLYSKNNQLIGVIGADFMIEKISSFLRQLSISDNSFVFVIHDKGKLHSEVIAFPDTKVSVVIKEKEKTRLRKIEELNIPIVTKAFQKHKSENINNFRLADNNGKSFYISFKSFRIASNKSWKIVFVVAEDDFTGSIKTTNKITLVISLLILVVSILIIAHISNTVSKPIVEITNEANKITNFEFDGKLEIKTFIKEISLVSTAMNKLKTGIQSFSKYVPYSLVKQLIEKGQDVSLGGKRSELTVFFSDIVGFTTISEKMRAESLMLHLSEYLNELTNIILQNNGTVDKYIGDAIMCFWGAPVQNKKHAIKACTAALKCQEKLNELNQIWFENNLPQMFTRIGIHTGECIVGNMGSKERMNYSIIGDHVNLASRLEGVNKVYGTQIIISQTTYDHVKDDVIVRYLDKILVKGRKEPIEIYELLSLSNQA